MLGSEKPQTTNFQAEYAERRDYCDVFERNMEALYLLAFLLTANHEEAEQCFASTVEDVFKEQVVFKEWTLAWVKRCLIKNAIQIVFSASARSGKRDFWSAGQHEADKHGAIDAVTTLASLDRFVFVMSVVERHSNWECSILLGCSISKVAETRMRALRRLPELGEISSGVGSPIARPQQVTA
jgi:DNA-directed RNA polymerase specialized sigma24 family protein